MVIFLVLSCYWRLGMDLDMWHQETWVGPVRPLINRGISTDMTAQNSCQSEPKVKRSSVSSVSVGILVKVGHITGFCIK